MKNVKKHQFEAVSLLTPENGTLEVIIIPTLGQPNWVVPTCLILQTLPQTARIDTYTWVRDDIRQDLLVYHLIPQEVEAQFLVILEGNSDKHRLALQTTGEITTLRVKISDVKDCELDEEERANIKNALPKILANKHDDEDYVYQAVKIGDELLVVPNLDLISHQLFDDE